MAAKKKTTRKKTTKKSSSKKKSTRRSAPESASGKQLVIVESPAKAKTINRYLGPDFVVRASVGHVRDLPTRAPKGSKQPVPGVDLEHDFEPTYEVLSDKKKVVTELRKMAKDATGIWFATDLDREGEAIAWHLAHVLDVEPAEAKRVVFNAITRAEIEKAFSDPSPIDEYKVNAQQARRILDRIVGYQASPLLWKKVARGLSAGRVQSVAVRLIVEREREIDAFVPEEHWRVTGRMTLDPSQAPGLEEAWSSFIETLDDKGKGPTVKAQNAWLAEQGAVKTELIEVGGAKFSLRTNEHEPESIAERVRSIADAVGLLDCTVTSEDNPKGKGPARTTQTVSGRVDPNARYRVKSVETKQTTSRPSPPFITSTLQMAAATSLGFGAQRTMRTAQSLYEGVNVPGEGQVGLITYMRTDSTHLTNEAIDQARAVISDRFGAPYLPETPNRFKSSNKDAQQAHEAIRPTNAARHPNDIASALTADQERLYRLIWNRFMACQMTPAKWNSTGVNFERIDKNTGAIMRSTGRVLAFDGFYRVNGIPTSSEEQTLPEMAEGNELAPFSLDPEQQFTSPPPRFSEASLVKELEKEGIGRPSTYASIIQVIQARNYVEQVDRRFHATDLGEVVTDKLIEAFPELLDRRYTREMEEKLDKVEEQHTNWQAMLAEFYATFSTALEAAHENLGHAKAETKPAVYACPECGSPTVYRFGKNGRFLSCSSYPDCNYAAPIDRDGRPMLPERVNVACPEDQSPMILRTGRFGKFLASVNYPDIDFVVNLDKNGAIKYPARPPVETDLKCEKCDANLYLRRGKRGPWLGCSTFPKCRGRMGWAKLEEKVQKELETRLLQHEKDHPQIIIHTL
ncbi:MAG: DNA topoisomerase family protein, partial [Planctomycetota bacterium]